MISFLQGKKYLIQKVYLHKQAELSYGYLFVNKLFHIINRGERGVFSTKKEKQDIDINI